MPNNSKTIEVTTRGIKPALKWLIASVSVILVAVGVVNLGVTIFKSSLEKYPLDSVKFSVPEVRVSPDGKELVSPELTTEQKQERQAKEQETRLLEEINDYGSAVGQLLSGFGLMYVYLLITKHERAYGRD